MGGINFDPSKLSNLGTSANKKNPTTPAPDTTSSNAPSNVTTSNNSGAVLDSLSALGNYNVGLVSSNKSSGSSNAAIADYLSANPSIAAKVHNTDPASIARIGQYAVNGYNAASSAGL